MEQVQNTKKSHHYNKEDETDEVSYTVVGFMKSPILDYPWSAGYSAISYLSEETIDVQAAKQLIDQKAESLSLCIFDLNLPDERHVIVSEHDFR